MEALVPTADTGVQSQAQTEDMQKSADLAALDAFGLSLADLRRDAINGRLQLGIEDEWIEDEEFYQGIDDANRAEVHATSRLTKPRASATASGDSKDRPMSTKSNLFMNITRPYVDSAAARMADMLLPVGDKSWEIEPSPIPEIDGIPPILALPDGTQMDHAQVMEAIEQIAKERGENASKRIEDWLVGCNFTPEARKVFEMAARIGTGVLKGPFPKEKRRIAWKVDWMTGKTTREVRTETSPASVSIDPWRLFPDPACGDNIQDGNYVWEMDSITHKRLVELKQSKEFITEQIEACLKEGPISAELVWTPYTDIERSLDVGKQSFEIWYFHGLVKVEDLTNVGVVLPPEVDNDHVKAVVTMVNHRVIRASLEPLDDSDFPYDVMVWQKRQGMPWGTGIARQIRAAQRMLLAAIRNLMDNAALSAGPQIVVNSSLIVPMNGVWELVPRKMWKRSENADPTEPVDVEEAFKLFSIETRQPELLNIINLALRMAEESTGLPMILQGQMGEKKVDTLGGMQMLQNNASAVLRRLAVMYDEQVTIPHISRYYAWLMQYGDDEEEKGDFVIKARGSSTLVEREIQNNEMLSILQAALNPAYGISPRKAAEEYLRSRRFDPARFELTEEDMAMQPTLPAEQSQADGEQKAAEQDAQASENQADRDHEKEMKLLDINKEHAQMNAERATETAGGDD